MAKLTLRYPAHELARLCELYFPEERRREFTSEPWDGASFRHYRDPKIACIEHFMPRHKPIGPAGHCKSGHKPAV